MSPLDFDLTIAGKHATEGDEPEWPGVHPEDPHAYHDDWRPGRCERCKTRERQLVRRVPCDATDCTGCIALCLEHAEEEGLS